MNRQIISFWHRRRQSLLFLIVYIFLTISYNKAFSQTPFKDVLVQSPTLKSPERGSVVGSFAKLSFGPADLMRGTFSLAGPFEVPTDRGNLLIHIFPSYSPENGISEWGMGWSTDLAIRRHRISGDIDYVTDEFASPWGGLQQGQDGNFYVKGLKSNIRLMFDNNVWKALGPDGTQFQFNQPVVTANGSFAWYLGSVITIKGDRTDLEYEKNTSGRPYLARVFYGRKNHTKDYRIIFNYDALEQVFTSYLSGQALILDRLVKGIVIQVKHAQTGDYKTRWQYELGYTKNPTGNAFYLSSIKKIYASGEEEPNVTYAYDLDQSYLEKASFVHLQELDDYLSYAGDDGIRPNKVTLTDIDEDGRVDMEYQMANVLVRKTDAGWTYENLPSEENIDYRCRRDVSNNNPPRILARMLPSSKEPHVVHTWYYPSQDLTSILICTRPGKAISESMISKNWHLGPNTRLIDLNRDQMPDVIHAWSGGYQVLVNQSDDNGFKFTAQSMHKLSPYILPEATWIHDVSGDGIPDLISRSKTHVVVWYGKGNFTFEEQGVWATLFDLEGKPFNQLQDYGLSFLDVNKDGLTDILISNRNFNMLYINRGVESGFYEQAVPAIQNLGSQWYLNDPVVADLSGSGEEEVVYTNKNKAYALKLTSAQWGLLTSANDGKGNIVKFTYARALPESGIGYRASILEKVTIQSGGMDDVSYSYTYQEPVLHSKGKFLLGFKQINMIGPYNNEKMSFYYDDEVSGILLEDVFSDERTKDLIKFIRYNFDERFYQGIRYWRPKGKQTGWRTVDGSSIYSSDVNFVEYEAEICPKRIERKSGQNTLVQELSRANLPVLANSMHCLHSKEKLTGKHTDPSLDFIHEQEVQYTTIGQVKKILVNGPNGPWVMQEVIYDSDHRLSKVHRPGQGTTELFYDSLTGMVKKVVNADKVSTSLGQLDPVQDAVLELIKDRGGNGIHKSFFRFDSMERLFKTWDNLSGSSEANPSELLSYSFPTLIKAGSIFEKHLVNPSTGSVREQTQLVLASGKTMANTTRIPEGWAIADLVAISNQQNQNTLYFHSPMSAASNIRSLSYSQLFDSGATALGFEQMAGFGHMHLSQETIQKGVTRSISTHLTLGAGSNGEGELIFTTTENNKQKTRQGQDMNGHTLWIEDQSGAVMHLKYDVLGRIVSVALADGTKHNLHFDAYGRPAYVERNGLGGIIYEYDRLTGLLTRKIYQRNTGNEERRVDFEYDSIGRVIKRTHTLSATGAKQVFAFEYDGGAVNPIAGQTGFLTRVKGAAYQRTDLYLANGKRFKSTVQIGDWMEIDVEWTYYVDGSLRSVFRSVRNLKQNTIVEEVGLEYLVDAYGREQKVLLDGHELLTLNYDSEGRVNYATFTNGTTLSMHYDEVTRGLKGYERSNGVWRAGLNWEFDERAHIVKETMNFGQKSIHRSYVYDARGFLTTSSDGSSTSTYTYSNIGLPETINDEKGFRKLIRNGSTLQAGNENYVYDELGRVIRKGGLTLKYGPNGQISEAQRGNKVWTFAYDDEGNRILKTSGEAPEVGYLGGMYITNSGVVEPFKVAGILIGVLDHGSLQIVDTDPRGTVLSDNSGAPMLATPYGVRIARPELSPALDYAEKGFDADLGLVRMGVRDYDPLISQFLTPDPLYLEAIEKCAESPIECNLYGYAGNNPLIRIDPTGKSFWGIFFSALEVVIGVVAVAVSPYNPLGWIALADGLDNLVGNIRTEITGQPTRTLKQFAGEEIAIAMGADEEVARGVGIAFQMAPGIALSLYGIGTGLAASVSSGGGYGMIFGSAAGGSCGVLCLSSAVSTTGVVATEVVATSSASASWFSMSNGEFKSTRPGLSGKEGAKDIPSWVSGEKPYVGENGKSFAKRLCDAKYGKGNYPTGPGSEFNKIKKWADRSFK